jgi:mono/diheme cytochrome c family protein
MRLRVAYDGVMARMGRSILLFTVTVATAGALALSVPEADSPKRVAQPGSAAHGGEIFVTVGCATCHAASIRDEASNELIRAGHPLEGAAWRGTWWNGRITTDAGEASDFCLRTFIDPNSEGFTAEERKALVLFMQDLGSERGVSPQVLLRRDAGDVDLRSGDPLRGRDLYRRACGSCHGKDAAAEKALIKQLSPLQVASVIRKGTGLMPFFQVDRLTAGQVADIAVYLESVRDAR